MHIFIFKHFKMLNPESEWDQSETEASNKKKLTLPQHKMTSQERNPYSTGRNTASIKYLLSRALLLK